jgi:hypothetical protein
MKIGDTVIHTVINNVQSTLYSNIVRRDLNDYKNTILYNNALTVLLIQPNYNQYGIRRKY